MNAAEDSIYDVITAAIDTAESDNALFEAELHDTVYRQIKKEFGVRVGDARAGVAPSSGYEEVEEFDALVPIVCFCRVTGTNKSDRKTARDKSRAIALAVARVIFLNPTLSDTQQSARPLNILRGWDNIDGAPYAVAHLPVIVNETGIVDYTNWRAQQ